MLFLTELIRTRYPILACWLLLGRWTRGGKGVHGLEIRYRPSMEGNGIHIPEDGGGKGERGGLVSFEGPVRENERSTSKSSTVCSSSLLVPSAKV